VKSTHSKRDNCILRLFIQNLRQSPITSADTCYSVQFGFHVYGLNELQERRIVLHRIARQLFLLSIGYACLCAADSLPPLNTPADTLVAVDSEALPISPVRDTASVILEAQLKSLHHPRTYPGCKVAPLPDIWDAEALAFEESTETAPIDTADLMPDTAEALDTFRDMVTSLGGTFDLKSAYRPPAYQAHLHEVWVKWKELRGDRSKACAALREDVGAEFARHELLVRQQPVPASDHMLGLAFDASVSMPRGARLHGKRVTLDRLAAMAGIKRPSIRRDPVHYKLIPEHPVAISSARSLSF
jgi:hypothetical protein